MDDGFCFAGAPGEKTEKKIKFFCDIIKGKRKKKGQAIRTLQRKTKERERLSPADRSSSSLVVERAVIITDGPSPKSYEENYTTQK